MRESSIVRFVAEEQDYRRSDGMLSLRRGDIQLTSMKQKPEINCEVRSPYSQDRNPLNILEGGWQCPMCEVLHENNTFCQIPGWEN